MQLVENDNNNKKLWKPKPVKSMMSKYISTTNLLLLELKMDDKKAWNIMVPHEDARFHFALLEFLWLLQVPHG